MGWEAPWHWVILAIVVIALFGYKKLPDASRALGRSLRIFKSEIKGMGEDDKVREAAKTPVQPQAISPAPVEPVVAPVQNLTPVRPAPVSTDKPAASGQ